MVVFKVRNRAVIHVEHQPSNPHTLQPGSTTYICTGGLLYVDDLALMSICPRELQSLLHACQHRIKKFDEMRCKLDSTENPRSFEKYPTLL